MTYRPFACRVLRDLTRHLVPKLTMMVVEGPTYCDEVLESLRYLGIFNLYTRE